jgi:uncharacterized protein (DUF58 family)
VPGRYEFFDEGFLSRLERLHLAGKHARARRRPGRRRSRRVGDGLEFADHRAYVPGDDARFIDWPYYARMERLLLRLFHEHSESDVGVLLDVSASMAPGGSREKFNYARRCAAALAYLAMGNLEWVRLMPFADRLLPAFRTGRSRREIFALLDFLAGLVPGGLTDLGVCARRLAAEAGDLGALLVVSDLLDCQDALADALARLRATTEQVVVLHVYSPADAAPELGGPVLLEQAESRRRRPVEATDDLLAAYRRAWRAFRTACERTCLGRGVTYVAVPTDRSFERLVLTTLRRAGVLAG